MGLFDLFDFNHDGKTSSFEMALGMKMMDECTREEDDSEFDEYDQEDEWEIDGNDDEG